ncbi:MAG TPA: hypothetical protein VGD26_12225, partial [Chitinophagaceae bacterium]
SFIMTVTDGQLDGTGIDKVRMKIFNKNTGQIYYDSQPGASDAADPTTPVGENSEVVIAGDNAPVTRSQENVTEETKPLAAKLSVTAYPNPYRQQFKLTITSPVSGMATIEFYNLLGARVYSARRPVTAGIGNTFIYPDLHRYGNLLYRVTVDDEQVKGIMIKPD